MPPSEKKWLEWTALTLDELLTGIEIIAEDNPAAALRVYERIDHAVELLASEPNIGRLGRVVLTRELPVSRTPFTLVYRETRNSLQVVHCLHQRRKYP
ncbi:MAG: type II toxin-antitoxin system RelE/ParE family toxin [Burkholderiales bacterium]